MFVGRALFCASCIGLPEFSWVYMGLTFPLCMVYWINCGTVFSLDPYKYEGIQLWRRTPTKLILSFLFFSLSSCYLSNNHSTKVGAPQAGPGHFTVIAKGKANRQEKHLSKGEENVRNTEGRHESDYISDLQSFSASHASRANYKFKTRVPFSSISGWAIEKLMNPNVSKTGFTLLKTKTIFYFTKRRRRVLMGLLIKIPGLLTVFSVPRSSQEALWRRVTWVIALPEGEGAHARRRSSRWRLHKEQLHTSEHNVAV